MSENNNTQETAPEITSAAAASIYENTTEVMTVVATGGGIAYGITGGDDDDHFTIDPETGDLSFISAPDYESINDTGQNFIYEVTVTATNSQGSDSQDLYVTVLDVAEIVPTITLTKVGVDKTYPQDYEPDMSPGYVEVSLEGALASAITLHFSGAGAETEYKRGVGGDYSESTGNPVHNNFSDGEKFYFRLNAPDNHVGGDFTLSIHATMDKTGGGLVTSNYIQVTMTLLTDSPAEISIGDITNIAQDGATISANITSTGGNEPHVTLYWATEDKGTEWFSWPSSHGFGTQGVGEVEHTITGLTPGTDYYFRFRASNAYATNGGDTWTELGTFTTLLGIQSPVIVGNEAEEITETGATLSANITDTGNEDPTVLLVWGNSDGGEVQGNWEYSEGFGSQGLGEVEHIVANQFPGATTYFRFMAENSGGQTWSVTKTFTTLEDVSNDNPEMLLNGDFMITFEGGGKYAPTLWVGENGSELNPTDWNQTRMNSNIMQRQINDGTLRIRQQFSPNAGDPLEKETQYSITITPTAPNANNTARIRFRRKGNTKLCKVTWNTIDGIDVNSPTPASQKVKTSATFTTTSDDWNRADTIEIGFANKWTKLDTISLKKVAVEPPVPGCNEPAQQISVCGISPADLHYNGTPTDINGLYTLDGSLHLDKPRWTLYNNSAWVEWYSDTDYTGWHIAWYGTITGGHGPKVTGLENAIDCPYGDGISTSKGGTITLGDCDGVPPSTPAPDSPEPPVITPTLTDWVECGLGTVYVCQHPDGQEYEGAYVRESGNGHDNHVTFAYNGYRIIFSESYGNVWQLVNSISDGFGQTTGLGGDCPADQDWSQDGTGFIVSSQSTACPPPSISVSTSLSHGILTITVDLVGADRWHYEFDNGGTEMVTSGNTADIDVHGKVSPGAPAMEFPLRVAAVDAVHNEYNDPEASKNIMVSISLESPTPTPANPGLLDPPCEGNVCVVTSPVETTEAGEYTPAGSVGGRESWNNGKSGNNKRIIYWKPDNVMDGYESKWLMGKNTTPGDALYESVQHGNDAGHGYPSCPWDMEWEGDHIQEVTRCPDAPDVTCGEILLNGDFSEQTGDEPNKQVPDHWTNGGSAIVHGDLNQSKGTGLGRTTFRRASNDGGDFKLRQTISELDSSEQFTLTFDNPKNKPVKVKFLRKGGTRNCKVTWNSTDGTPDADATPSQGLKTMRRTATFTTLEDFNKPDTIEITIANKLVQLDSVSLYKV